MSRISRLVVLVTLVATIAGVIAGSAGAVTWHVSGPGVFHATAGQVMWSATNSNLVCPSITTSNSYATGSIVSPIYGIAGTITVTGCSLAGQSSEMTCGYTLTVVTQPAATVATGNLDLTCGWTFAASGVKFCHIEGAAHAIYTKSVAPTLDTLAITTTSTLRATGSGCILGPNDTVHLSALTFTFTSPGGPHITRTV